MCAGCALASAGDRLLKRSFSAAARATGYAAVPATPSTAPGPAAPRCTAPDPGRPPRPRSLPVPPGSAAVPAWHPSRSAQPAKIISGALQQSLDTERPFRRCGCRYAPCLPDRPLGLTHAAWRAPVGSGEATDWANHCTPSRSTTSSRSGRPSTTTIAPRRPRQPDALRKPQAEDHSNDPRLSDLRQLHIPELLYVRCVFRAPYRVPSCNVMPLTGYITDVVM